MSNKKTYRVLATMETDLYLDVEANSKEEAIEIAENTDAGKFLEDGAGAWNVYDAVLLTAKDKKKK